MMNAVFLVSILEYHTSEKYKERLAWKEYFLFEKVKVINKHNRFLLRDHPTFMCIFIHLHQ